MKLVKTISKLKNGDELTLCALGDSLTQGWMVSRGYLDFLKEFIQQSYPSSKLKIINRGIPGDTADGGLDRLREDVTDYDPDLVFIQFGLNDLYMGYPVIRFKNCINAIVQTLLDDSDAEIILLTSIKILDARENKAAAEFYGAIEGVAEEKGVALCGVHEYWDEKIRSGAEHGSLVQYDGVHPTVEGYRLMAEAIMKTIKSFDKD